MKNFKLITLGILTIALQSCQSVEQTGSTNSKEASSSSTFTDDSSYVTCDDIGIGYLMGEWEDSSHVLVMTIEQAYCSASLEGSPAGMNGYSTAVEELVSARLAEFNDNVGVHDFKWSSQRAYMSSNNTIMTVGGRVLTKR